MVTIGTKAASIYIPGHFYITGNLHNGAPSYVNNRTPKSPSVDVMVCKNLHWDTKPFVDSYRTETGVIELTIETAVIKYILVAGDVFWNSKRSETIMKPNDGFFDGDIITND